jgi:hypothetical protein
MKSSTAGCPLFRTDSSSQSIRCGSWKKDCAWIEKYGPGSEKLSEAQLELLELSCSPHIIKKLICPSH